VRGARWVGVRFSKAPLLAVAWRLDTAKYGQSWKTLVANHAGTPRSNHIKLLQANHSGAGSLDGEFQVFGVMYASFGELVQHNARSCAFLSLAVTTFPFSVTEVSLFLSAIQNAVCLTLYSPLIASASSSHSFRNTFTLLNHVRYFDGIP